ncbi:hypothetical protein ABFS83_05G089200 [Erythranthe nasuta]
MEELIARLKTEEDNKITDKGGQFVAKAHVVESSNQSNKRNGLTFNKGPNNKKKRFTGACFVCGKNGHLAKDCRHRKETIKMKQMSPWTWLLPRTTTCTFRQS